MKKISIIVPVYNGEKYIKKCIDSLLNQDLDNYEIVVINDGSTDKTLEILNNIKNDKLVIKSILNSGVSNARNIGIDLATGKYIMFVDSDDYIEKNTLKYLYDQAELNQIDIIRFNGYIENSKHQLKKLEFLTEENEIIDSTNNKEKIVELFNNPVINMRCYTPLLFMKNENIKKFNTSVKYLEDKLFYMDNLLDNKKIMFINKYLYYYVYNSNSKTKKSIEFEKNIYDLLESKKYLIEILNKYNLSNYSKMIDESYLSLILYRLEYYATICEYKDFYKSTINLLNISMFNKLLIKNNNMNFLKKIEFNSLKNKKIRKFYKLANLKERIKR